MQPENDSTINQILCNQIALFNLVGDLYHRLIGKVPTVDIHTKNGIVPTFPNLYDVKCSDALSKYSDEIKEWNRTNAVPLSSL